MDGGCSFSGHAKTYTRVHDFVKPIVILESNIKKMTVEMVMTQFIMVELDRLKVCAKC